ncbi:helix-turn-helix domain-containing protein [Natronincola ferrireducens]|uniref:Helix-turn-helix n=1 Tax=Natronincola ferrireducens TaxID=393762 RepID=A0A1G9I2M6_9FIRM|nr:helix-turn-helix transcriptional regulator [Natronincola ferrireducens]SDL19490.1 Helix-turn-helix [Natronincola ferrireducens]
MYRNARNSSGKSRAKAAEELYISERTLAKIESGEVTPAPEIAERMNEVYEVRHLSMWYCKEECPIGQKYCYEILDNVDLSPMAIFAKYRQEAKEAHEALDQLTELMLNKKDKNDCSQTELDEIRRCGHELLDLEHVIETFKLRLWDFLDVQQLIYEHNEKCQERGYVKKENNRTAATVSAI